MQFRHCSDLNSPLSEICSIPLATERQHVLRRLPVFARFSRRIPSSDQSPTAPRLPAPMRQRSRRYVFFRPTMPDRFASRCLPCMPQSNIFLRLHAGGWSWNYLGCPVSYTHLRAHETDSYLVCRLLLEKKKKN